jgi:hypothetical protein
MSGPELTDFVPLPCEAHRIANCILEGDCTLTDFELPSYETYFTKLKDDEEFGLAAIQVQINDLDACFIASLALAFNEAACDMPPIPQPPDPDEIREKLDECIERVQESAAEGASNIGEWAKAMTVTFGEDGLPTRIQVP